MLFRWVGGSLPIVVGLPRKGHLEVRERLDRKPRRDNSYCAAINGPQRGLKTCRRTQNIKFVGELKKLWHDRVLSVFNEEQPPEEIPPQTR